MFQLTGSRVLVPVRDSSGGSLHPPRPPQRAARARAPECAAEAPPTGTPHEPHGTPHDADARDYRFPISHRRSAVRRSDLLLHFC